MIAKISNGYAACFSQNGHLLKSINFEGINAGEDTWSNVIQYLSKNIPLNTPVEVQIDTANGSSAWLLPIHDIIIAASNVTAKEEESRIQHNFEQALPSIAMVAGGEAALFDKNGRRYMVYWSDGKAGPGINEVSPMGKKAMNQYQHILGPSVLEEGVLSIRVPITRNFGFGFNNLDTVRRKKQLLQTQGHHWSADFAFSDIVGSSKIILQCINTARKFASTDSTILISGETGTGKEVFAQSIHNASSRKNGPFLAINCGAIPPTLIDSFLFGHEPGSFTGANKHGQKGIFEEAYGGTIFLDAISEMEYSLQSNLLRVLQERKIVKIGGARPIEVDVRVIAATNRNLLELVKNKLFREDLYYRLNVLELNIPPLRDRPEDIEELAYYFLNYSKRKQVCNVDSISKAAMLYLNKYSWPGNVRQMQNVILKSINLCDGREIYPDHLPISVFYDDAILANNTPLNMTHVEHSSTLNRIKKDQNIQLKEKIIKLLEEEGLNRRRVAAKLGMSTVTLWRKMKELGID